MVYAFLRSFINSQQREKDEFTNEEKQALQHLNEDEIFSFLESGICCDRNKHFIFVESVNAEELTTAKLQNTLKKAAKIIHKKAVSNYFKPEEKNNDYYQSNTTSSHC